MTHVQEQATGSLAMAPPFPEIANAAELLQHLLHFLPPGRLPDTVANLPHHPSAYPISAKAQSILPTSDVSIWKPLWQLWTHAQQVGERLDETLRARARNRELRYVFRVEGIEAQQALIASFMDLGCKELELCPLVHDRPSVLFRVRAAANLVTLLEALPGQVFWGPLDFDETSGSLPEVYLQWPHALGHVASTAELLELRKLLSRLPWPISSGAILLGPEQRIQVRADSEQIFRSLTSLAQLAIRSDAPAVPSWKSSEADPTPQSPLRVQLRVAAPERTDQIKSMLLRLEREIEVRVARWNALNEQVEAPPDGVREPLLIFPDKGDLPESLKRLLLEWSDQDEALGSLRYARVSGAFPPFDAGVYHVVTTARALELPGDDTPKHMAVAARLYGYAPSLGQGLLLERLPDWLPELQIFVPQGQTLRFEPELLPGRASGRKLAATLLNAIPAADRTRCAACVLGHGEGTFIVPLYTDALRGGFKSLVSRISWQCEITALAPLTADEQVGLIESEKGAIERAGTLALNAAMTGTMMPQLEQLRTKSKEFASRMEDAEKHLHSLDDLLKLDASQLATALQALGEALAETAAATNAGSRTLERLRDEIRRVLNP